MTTIVRDGIFIFDIPLDGSDVDTNELRQPDPWPEKCGASHDCQEGGTCFKFAGHSGDHQCGTCMRSFS